MSSKGNAKKATSGDQLSKRADGHSYNNLMMELHANPYKFTYKTYGTSKEIVIQQDFEFGIGGVLWDCGLILAKYLSLPENQSRWQGKVVVELGAATALPALVAWQLGAKAVATDLAEVVGPITTPNIHINTVNASKLLRKSILPAVCAWGEDADADALLTQCPLVKENGGVIDFVIAADVVYRGEDHPKLLHTIERLASEKTVIIFVHRSRVSNDGNFVDPLKAAFVQTKAVNAKSALPSYPKDNATIYEFCGRRATQPDDEEPASAVQQEDALLS